MKYKTRIDPARHYGTPLYGVWASMKYRCSNPKSISYKNYGGRGISVCDEWAADYATFYAWALKNGYKKGLQIDRVNNDLGYAPENCRWVSRETNCNNKSNNVHVEYDGKRYTAAQFAREYGLKYDFVLRCVRKHFCGEQILRTRLKPCKRSWSVEQRRSKFLSQLSK